MGLYSVKHWKRIYGDEERKRAEEYDISSHNKAVTASPPYGGSGSTKTQSGYSPFVRFCSATFCQPWSLLRKALIRAGKTSVTAKR